MQPKITLHRTGSEWQACLDGAPSTWIIKVAQPLDAPSGDVVNTEVLSLDLARNSGLDAAYAELHLFDDVRAIAVQRYDRKSGADGLERIHQEDLAQALGLNTEDPLRKFQRGNAMPSLAHAAEVLRSGGSEPDDLLRLTTINFVLGNIDAHAKNISFLRLEDGTAVLAPAYDIAMHTHHDDEPHRSALDINGKINLADIDADDLIAEGRSWRLPATRAARVVNETVNSLHSAVAPSTSMTTQGSANRLWPRSRVASHARPPSWPEARRRTDLVGKGELNQPWSGPATQRIRNV